MAYTTVDDGSEYFQTALYTGNQNASVAVVNDGNSDLQPDWVWGKNRDSDSNHWVVDSSRGVTKTLFPDLTSAEETQGSVNAFNTDGFTLGDWIGSTKTNEAYVAWQWKANGGTTTDFSASGNQLAGGFQANTTAGFSIIDYTSAGNSGKTIQHGLNSAPTFVLIKNRTDASSWAVFHAKAQTSGAIRGKLNETDAFGSNTGIWNNTVPDSSNITLGNNDDVNSLSSGDVDPYICYAFHDVQGYSKFGSYTGNNNANGAFVYTGFKPAWLMVKRATDAARAWVIHDNTQDTFNVTANRLDANTSEENQSSGHFDFLSNGFKCRSTEGATNAASAYLYMAFAEHPFVSSKGVPTTAR